MANLVRFGLKNVHYAIFTEGSSGAAGTYGTPKPLIGAVQMTTTPEGDSYTFYADDVAFYATETNAGYSRSTTTSSRTSSPTRATPRAA